VAREDNILLSINSGSGPPLESTGPLYIRTGPPGKVQDPHGHEPDPWDGFRTPLCGVQATLSRVSGFWGKEYPDFNQGQAGVRSRHVSGPYRIRFCSPLRRRPDAATWPTARDVSQRAKPDVRPLGRATSAFIVDKPHRLSTPLAGDVPPQHLMCLVHSTGRRCAASAFNVPCPLRCPSCRRRACLFRWQAVRPCCGIHCAHHHSRVTKEAARHINTVGATDIMALGDLLGDAGIGYFYMYSLHFAPGPTCWGSAPLYVPPLSYKRGGT
jgi:hypothetical protein